MAANPDPSPEEIEQLTAEIRATWSERERMSRLRSDQRPTHRLADGRREAMSSSVYNGHHERG